MWTIGSILSWTTDYFQAKGLDTPRLDAEVLLAEVLKKDRLYLYVHFDQPLQETELTEFRQFVKQRVQRTPVAYILGSKSFMGFDFKVSPAVLIPRPDTEILVEDAYKRLQKVENPFFIDIGTGSGAIALSLLKLLPQAKAVALDISAEALMIAQANAELLGVHDRVRFVMKDMHQGLTGTYDAILSNPPYITEAEMKELQPEVKQEPVRALVGGSDGLDFYRLLVQIGPKALKPSGFMSFEVGAGQAQTVAALGCQHQLEVQAILEDYNPIERVVVFSLAKEGKQV